MFAISNLSNKSTCLQVTALLSAYLSIFLTPLSHLKAISFCMRNDVLAPVTYRNQQESSAVLYYANIIKVKSLLVWTL